MRRYAKQSKLIAIITFLLLCGAGVVDAGGRKAGEVVVKVTNNGQVASVAAEVDAVVDDSIPSSRTYLLKFPPNRSVDEVITQLNSNSDVELVSSNIIIELPEVFQISQGFPDESEPVYNKGISPQDFYEQTGSYNIGIDSAHLISTGEGVVVAVIDNGLDFTQPLIQNSIILNGHDFVFKGNDASEEPGSIYGHGTFVTGLLLLTAPDVSIMPLRAFNSDGIGDQFNVAKAIDWAVRHGADIINMSFGTSEMIGALQTAIDNASDNNVVMVAASGNEGSIIPHYPAAHPDVIAVASVYFSELLADFSNYGDYLDLVAPGVNLYSSLAGSSEWGYWSGTSFSAPIVSGTVAMIKQLEMDYTPSEIQNHLRNTARNELLWGSIIAPDEQYGYGMINCYEAVLQLSMGDLNGSGTRDIVDLSIMMSIVPGQGNGNGNNNGNSNGNAESELFFDSTTTAFLADINCDGVVNMADVALLSHHIFVKPLKFAPCDN